MVTSPRFESEQTLLPAIAQDHVTGRVLMLAWMNDEAYRETLTTGYATYFSRSRGKLWRKGEESGHRQRVISIAVDCDADAILLQVEQIGAACHEGYRSCFFRSLTSQQFAEAVDGSAEFLVNEPRVVDPEQAYGNKQYRE